MNPVAQKVFDSLKEATKNSANGEGILGSGAFRLLWEPKEFNNTFEELATRFNRNELAQQFITTVSQKHKIFDAMKQQMQHDLIAVAHRDMTFRYSSRIHRILDEAGRRKNIQTDKSGLLANMQDNVEKFLAVEEAQS
jgi:hypothetical protein